MKLSGLGRRVPRGLAFTSLAPQLSVKRRAPSSPANRSGFVVLPLSGTAAGAREVPLSLLSALSMTRRARRRRWGSDGWWR
jgi:hypothetical protein